MRECWINVYWDDDKNKQYFGHKWTHKVNAIELAGDINKLLYRIHVRMK